jgi:hypothetical protein
VTVDHPPHIGSEPRVDQPPDFHLRDGQWCGPVEIDQPSEAPDDPVLSWKG